MIKNLHYEKPEKVGQMEPAMQFHCLVKKRVKVVFS